MRLARDLPYWLLVLASGLWVGLAFLAPYARQQDWALGPLVYAFFDPVCHQIPERSFWWLDRPLAVCQRCLGLYLGFVSGLLVWPGLGRLRTSLVRNPRVVCLFFVPMLIDVFLIENTYLTRFATGLVATFPVALLAWTATGEIFRSTDRLQGGDCDEPSASQ